MKSNFRENKKVLRAFTRCFRAVKNLSADEFERVIDPLIRTHATWTILRGDYDNIDFPDDSVDAIDEIDKDLEKKGKKK